MNVYEFLEKNHKYLSEIFERLMYTANEAADARLVIH
jgi:hypothetical protein